MYNAASKLTIVALVAAAMLAGCKSEQARRAERAEALRLEAETLAANGDYEQSLALLDSLDSAYREQTDVRRSAMTTRAKAIERHSMRQIGRADSVLAAAQLCADSLAAFFVRVDGPRGLEGHYVERGIKGRDVTASTGIEPRVDEQGYLCIAAVVRGRSIGLNSLSVTTASGTLRVEPAGAGRAISSEGSELTSFRQEEVADIMQALEAAGDGPVAMQLTGSKGTADISLSPAMRTALVRSWQYAMARQRLRSALIERERLERMLRTARNHLADAPVSAPASKE